jgi:hypothetical protein
MDELEFWKIVERAREESVGGSSGFVAKVLGLLGLSKPRSFSSTAFMDAVRVELGRCTDDQLVGFKIVQESLMDRAYTWPLWGAAYTICGGCSDDGFMDWRSWLIAQGRERFERSLADPDSLADLEGIDPDEAHLEEFLYVASELFGERTGGDLWDRVPENSRRGSSEEPAGERWEEGTDDLARMLPRLTSRYGKS